MVNFGLNSASILGIALAGAGASLYFLRSFRPELARDHDIFFSAVGLICGLILLFQGWRLDPVLLVGQVLLTGSAAFFAVESIRLRGLATDQARRRSPIVDEDDRPMGEVYRAELDQIEPYQTEDRYERRLRGYAEPRSNRTRDYGEEPPRGSGRARPTRNDPPQGDYGAGDRPSRPPRRRPTRASSPNRRPRPRPDQYGGYETEENVTDVWSEDSWPEEQPRRPRRSRPAGDMPPRRPRPNRYNPAADDEVATVEYRPVDGPEADLDQDWDDPAPGDSGVNETGDHTNDNPVNFDY